MKVNYKKFFAAIAAAAMCAVPMTNAMYAGAAPADKEYLIPYQEAKQAELDEELQKIKKEQAKEEAKEYQKVEIKEFQREEIPKDYYIEGEISSESLAGFDEIAFSPDHPCGNDPTFGPHFPKGGDDELVREFNTKEFNTKEFNTKEFNAKEFKAEVRFR